jgi:pimeloyl-ACP methyl ester carboxylesterase
LRRVNGARGEVLATQLATNLTKPTHDGKLTWSWDTLHRARNARPFDSKPFMAFLREITAPTLLVHGADSQFIPSDYEARRRSLQHAEEVVLPGAGHLVHHDQPDALAELINSFFNAQGRD